MESACKAQGAGCLHGERAAPECGFWPAGGRGSARKESTAIAQRLVSSIHSPVLSVTALASRLRLVFSARGPHFLVTVPGKVAQAATAAGRY